MKISGLYDTICARGTHLKFMNHPHNMTKRIRKGDNI